MTVTNADLGLENLNNRVPIIIPIKGKGLMN